MDYNLGLRVGYNKAKEKYKYTEDDVRKAIEMARELDGLHFKNGAAYKIIQSLHQYPTEFECELVTTAQGIQWIGKYK